MLIYKKEFQNSEILGKIGFRVTNFKSEFLFMDPLVTILIPTYNREKYIFDALNSAVNQTYRNIEVLVVDNASTDNTLKIVQKFSADDNRIKIIENETNIGPLLNWKRGIEAASAEFIKILWSDDIMDLDFLNKTVPLLKDNVGFVISEVLIGPSIESSTKLKFDIKAANQINSKTFIEKILLGANLPVSPGCSLFRKHDLVKNLTISNTCFTEDRFRENGAGPDLLFFLKACLDYKYFSFTPETYCFFREHLESISIAEKSKKIGFDYLRAKIFFAEMANHRFTFGLNLERLLRKDSSKLVKSLEVKLIKMLGIFEYFSLRFYYLLKRKVT